MKEHGLVDVKELREKMKRSLEEEKKQKENNQNNGILNNLLSFFKN